MIYSIILYIYIGRVGSGGGSHCSYPIIMGPCIANVMILLQRSRYDEQCIAMTKKRLAHADNVFAIYLMRMRRPSMGQVLTHTAIS